MTSLKLSESAHDRDLALECHGDLFTGQPAIECHGDAIFGQPAIECHGDFTIGAPAAFEEAPAGSALSPLVD